MFLLKYILYSLLWTAAFLANASDERDIQVYKACYIDKSSDDRIFVAKENLIRSGWKILDWPQMAHPMYNPIACIKVGFVLSSGKFDDVVILDSYPNGLLNTTTLKSFFDISIQNPEDWQENKKYFTIIYYFNPLLPLAKGAEGLMKKGTNREAVRQTAI